MRITPRPVTSIAEPAQTPPQRSVEATSALYTVILLVSFSTIAQAITIAVIAAGFSPGQDELEVPRIFVRRSSAFGLSNFQRPWGCTRAALPGVGQNLIDHAYVGMSWFSRAGVV
jgi:hypothetical protein